LKICKLEIQPQVAILFSMQVGLPKKRISRHNTSAHTGAVFQQKRNTQKVLNRSPKKKEAPLQHKRYSYFVRIFLSGLLFLSVIGVILVGYRMWQKSLQLQYSYTALLIPSDSASTSYVVSLRGRDQSVHIIALPQTFGEDEESVNVNMREVNQLIRQRGDDTLGIRSAVSLKLGLPIDTVLFVDSPFVASSKSDLLEIFSPFNSKKLHGQLTTFDKAQIEKYLFSVDPAHVEQLSFFQRKEPNNGSELIAQYQWLNMLQKYFSDTAVRQQAPTIAVINATTQNGLARQLGDVFNAWGFTVVQLESGEPEAHEKTELIIDDRLKDSAALKRLERAMPIELKYKSDQNVLQKYRSQMVLVVGQDL
jgi:hypothetical protein